MKTNNIYVLAFLCCAILSFSSCLIDDLNVSDAEAINYNGPDKLVLEDKGHVEYGDVAHAKEGDLQEIVAEFAATMPVELIIHNYWLDQRADEIEYAFDLEFQDSKFRFIHSLMAGFDDAPVYYDLDCIEISNEGNSVKKMSGYLTVPNYQANIGRKISLYGKAEGKKISQRAELEIKNMNAEEDIDG